jgi:release factor glutamine methyltransferase
MTVGEAVIRGTAILKAAGLPVPALDAALLLADILNTDKTGLVLAGPEPLNEDAYRRFEGALERRRAGECTAYIRGRKEFWGLDFAVTADVLVPRPDTETLVEAALSRIDELTRVRTSGKSAGSSPFRLPVRLLDLCTGSGAVAVALKYERPALWVCASDISGKALAVAKKNARRNLPPAVDGKLSIQFIESDLFNRLEEAVMPDSSRPVRFDLIVSNPPYIPTAVLAALSPEVRREPSLALDGGKDGLSHIRRIIAGAPPFLNPGGAVFMEADPDQMPSVARLLESQGYRGTQIYRDIAGRMRVVSGNYSG